MKIDRLFVVSLGAITGLASCSSGQDEEAQRPNILILLADDAGYADFGFMGATDIQTPNIDRLAAEGCIFTDAHVAATVSSPSRSMMLTGRYGQRTDMNVTWISREMAFLTMKNCFRLC